MDSNKVVEVAKGTGLQIYVSTFYQEGGAPEFDAGIKAWMNANTRKSYWRIAGSPTLSTTLTNEYFRNIGLQSIEERYLKLH